ncbi:MAG: heme NO-binding domain-containing protein [Phycisphaerales bacterium]|nr:heme NO-binding domain-containing protein [Phycisphaerales bacterium]MCB9856215.1 heme NO-binding domain-containing protein [Phycisphaerales bacterium]MCB9863346.1 heme NO-binding domain-containing protein [Phycisphaerales bacterium]
MVGLVHTVLLNMIDKQTGTAATADIRRMAGLAPEQEFRIDENYDDAEFLRLFVSTCERLGLTQAQAESAFARAFYEDAVKRWPTWFRISRNAREFLKRQPGIHNGFATGISDSSARAGIRDKFRVEDRADRLIVHYKSPNRLCGYYVALANEIFDHYHDSARIEHMKCMLNGDDACEIHVIWQPSEDPM